MPVAASTLRSAVEANLADLRRNRASGRATAVVSSYGPLGLTVQRPGLRQRK